jgi:hypothetical protein
LDDLRSFAARANSEFERLRGEYATWKGNDMSDKEYCRASAARSGLLYMRGVSGVALGDRVVVRDHSGRRRNGQVIRPANDLVLIQVLEGTDNLDLERTWVRFLDQPFEIALSPTCWGACSTAWASRATTARRCIPS